MRSITLVPYLFHCVQAIENSVGICSMGWRSCLPNRELHSRSWCSDWFQGSRFSWTHAQYAGLFEGGKYFLSSKSLSLSLSLSHYIYKEVYCHAVSRHISSILGGQIVYQMDRPYSHIKQWVIIVLVLIVQLQFVIVKVSGKTALGQRLSFIKFF